MTFTRVLCMAALSGATLLAGDKEDVLVCSNSWRQAVIKQDKATLAKLLAEDLEYSHASGKEESKAEYMQAVTGGPARYESFTDSQTKIRVFGKTTAVLAGFVDVKLIGRPAYRVKTLEVYVKNKGQWQMTAHQSTRIQGNQ